MLEEEQKSTTYAKQVKALGCELQSREKELQRISDELRQQIIRCESLNVSQLSAGEERERLRYEWQLTLQTVQQQHGALEKKANNLQQKVEAHESANARLAREKLALERMFREKMKRALDVVDTRDSLIADLQQKLRGEETKCSLMRRKCTELQLSYEAASSIVSKLKEENRDSSLRLRQREEDIKQMEQSMTDKINEIQCLRDEFEPLIQSQVDSIKRIKAQADDKLLEEKEVRKRLELQLLEALDERQNLETKMRERNDVLTALDSRLDELYASQSQFVAHDPLHPSSPYATSNATTGTNP